MNLLIFSNCMLLIFSRPVLRFEISGFGHPYIMAMP